MSTDGICPFCFLPYKNPKTHDECIWNFLPLSSVLITYMFVNVNGIDLKIPVNYYVENAKQWSIN